MKGIWIDILRDVETEFVHARTIVFQVREGYRAFSPFLRLPQSNSDFNPRASNKFGDSILSGIRRSFHDDTRNQSESK